VQIPTVHCAGCDAEVATSAWRDHVEQEGKHYAKDSPRDLQERFTAARKTLDVRGAQVGIDPPKLAWQIRAILQVLYDAGVTTQDQFEGVFQKIMVEDLERLVQATIPKIATSDLILPRADPRENNAARLNRPRRMQ